MSKRCAKCEKLVYPTEELKCLDKTWHKFCFKCDVCGMTLNMKNYKGYNKLPYCNAHYPTTSFTAVAETPEMARIAQNTKIQSNLKYHEDFEKSRGKYTAVTDDPESRRLRANTDNFSSIQYHEQHERDRGKYTSVADDPEVKRHLKNTQNISSIQYQSEFNESLGKYTQIADDPETLRVLKNQQNVSMIKYHEDFEKNVRGKKLNVVDDPETRRIQEHGKIISNVDYHGMRQKHDDMEKRRTSVNDDSQPGQMQRRASDRDPRAGGETGAVPSPYSAKFTGHSTTYSAAGKVEHSQPKRQVGSISDYDPMSENWGSLGKSYSTPQQGGSARQEWEETIPQPGRQAATENNHGPSSPRQPAAPQQNVPLVPVNQTLSLQVHHPSEPEQNQQPRYYPAPNQPQQQQVTSPTEKQPSFKQQSPRGYQPPPQAPAPVQQQVRKEPAYQALYDYEAQDDDEISFMEHDVIFDTEPIDEGWMYGTVQRTGKRGMLPSNYVEKV